MYKQATKNVTTSATLQWIYLATVIVSKESN